MIRIVSIILLLLTTSAFAFDFEIDRIRLELSLDQPVQGLRIRNNNQKTPVNLQASVVSWKQENGKDIYAPSNDLIIAPSVVTIPPARGQIMRVGWRAPTPIATELAYRVYIQQLNAAALDTRIGVQFKLSMGLPIFIKPVQPIYQYSWIVKRSGNGYSLTFQNTGNVHFQISQIELFDQNDKPIGTYKTPFYVLAKQSATVQVPASAASGGAVKIVATTDYQPLSSTVRVT